uniref:Putative secreted protein n=1 Tax=Xenopsylla cheopis TaxID=163159 RepID=A0A6M2DZI7_XENCH
MNRHTIFLIFVITPIFVAPSRIEICFCSIITVNRRSSKLISCIFARMLHFLDVLGVDRLHPLLTSLIALRTCLSFPSDNRSNSVR